MSYSPHTPQAAHPHALKLSRDPERAMQEMMDAIDRIRDVYQRETDILRKADMSAFMELQTEKFEVAQTYQSGVEQMLNRREEMKQVNPLLRKRLEAMQQEFTDLTRHNMDALERMKRTIERMSEKIQFVAKEEVRKQRAFSYGQSGQLRQDERKAISTGIIETA